ncbi:Vha26 [Symbiodinium sp. CCMP2592]|nr:Vha26 [Symbiodinium sp. CCMP2592]
MALKEQHIGVRVRRGLDMPPRWINMQLDHARRPDEQVPKSPASVGSEVEEEEPLLDHEACGVDIVLNIYDVSNLEPVRWFNTLFAYEHAPVKLGGFFHVGVQVGDEECLS